MASTEFPLDTDKYYLVDGLQRYYAVKELNDDQYEQWYAYKLEGTEDTVDEIQEICFNRLVLNNTVTPMTFVDKCNMIVKFSSRQK